MAVDYDWCVIGDAPAEPSIDIWHAVAPGSATTVCKLPVANPDEEWRWQGKLGHRRACDNCGKVALLAMDVEAAIASERDPVVKPGASTVTGA
jgi:hypothetical protein